MPAKQALANPKRLLTKRQLRFLDEFPKDLNVTQAARRAGYSARTAKEQAYRLLKQLHEHVSQYVAEAVCFQGAGFASLRLMSLPGSSSQAPYGADGY